MKILITGAAGQLATELSHTAVTKDLHLIMCNREQLDICVPSAIEQMLLKHAPDWVVNTAAYTAVDHAESESDAAFAVNCTGVENLALACKAQQIPLLHISTDYVFSGEHPRPYKEIDQCVPLNVYGESKLAGEQILRATWEQHIILRTAWVYGNYGQNFLQTMLRLAREKKSLQIVADQLGSPTATTDIAAAIFAIIQSEKHQWGIYHFTNQGITTWYEFAKAIIELDSPFSDYPMPEIKAIESADYKTAARRPRYSVLDCTKIQKDYGIIPRPWQTALADVMRKNLSCHITQKIF